MCACVYVCVSVSDAIILPLPSSHPRQTLDHDFIFHIPGPDEMRRLRKIAPSFAVLSAVCATDVISITREWFRGGGGLGFWAAMEVPNATQVQPSNTLTSAEEINDLENNVRVDSLI